MTFTEGTRVRASDPRRRQSQHGTVIDPPVIGDARDGYTWVEWGGARYPGEHADADLETVPA